MKGNSIACLVFTMVFLISPLSALASEEKEEYTFLLSWPSPSFNFNLPVDVTIDSLGNIYVADNHNHLIQKVDPDGNVLTKWGTEGSGDGQLKYPNGIAVDSEGTVYVADTYNHRVQKFDSEGNFLAKWGESIYAQLNSPEDVAFW